MATLGKGYDFGATEEVTSAKLADLVDNATITGILTAEIADSQITNAKIADVSGAKFTNLANIPSGAGTIPVANIPTLTASLLAALYPVGSIYINKTNATNPGTIFGFGTWTAIQNVALYGKGSGTFANAGDTGGAETKTISANNLPEHTHSAGTLTGGAHTHTIPRSTGGGTTGSNYAQGLSDGTPGTFTSSSEGAVSVTGSTGNNTTTATALNVMNPYLVVYMWERTA